MENAVVTEGHFADLRDQIEKIKEENLSIVFDYEKQEKEARSHVATLRKSKKAISDRHKEKKEFFLVEGRKIDSAKNELIADVEEMIDVHANPLKEIKDRKDKKIEDERALFKFTVDWDNAIVDNDLFKRERDLLKREAEQARIKAKEEAERLEKERVEREEQIRKDAAEQAIKDSEEKIRKEKEESERKITEATEKAEYEKQEALYRQRREMEEKERVELERIAEEKRIAKIKSDDRDHQKAVNNKVLEKLVKCGLSKKDAMYIIVDIIKNSIPELSINY